MKVLLTLFCLIILTGSGCKQSSDPFEFDNIVSIAYSNIITTSLPDSNASKTKKIKEFKFLRIKKDTVKVDSCHHTPDCFIQVL